MTNPSDDLLVTSEGVDEGSAASTAESPRSAEAAGASDPVDGGERAPDGGDRAPAGGSSESTPAPPVDMESGQSRSAREAVGSGQQLEAGEG